MRIIRSIKQSLLRSKYHLKSNTVESIIWLVNLVPSRAGFSILNDTFSPFFWILHLSLLVYVYGAGNVVYQAKFAQGPKDFIKSYLNISILILTANITYWFLMKRSLLRNVLKKVNENDRLSKQTDFLRDKHDKLLSVVKRIVLIFYGCNLFNAFVIYLPHRIDVSNDYYAMTLCVGIAPLTVTPKKEICQAILLLQEMTIMSVVLNHQALLLFLIDHTSIMYHLLSAEMLAFDDYKDCPESSAKVKERLPLLIKRHVLTLDIIKNLKALYSMPIGINFGSSAVCICLFFYLPLHEWMMFIPILFYCFVVFFLYCFLCQRLINASEVFESAVYRCGWEKFDIKEKKSVYIMLLLAQKPVVLLAADIIPVNIHTFATTLRAMFKFITVVKF